MPLALPHDLQEFLEHLVAEGKYASGEQTMLDTIMLLECRELLRVKYRKVSMMSMLANFATRPAIRISNCGNRSFVRRAIRRLFLPVSL